MRNTHFRTEIWRRKTEKVENLEMSTVGREYGKKKLKIAENEKHPLDDFENDANH